MLGGEIKMILKLKYIFIGIFYTLVFNAQTYRGAVIGKYYGKFEKLNSSLNVIQTCNSGALELTVSSYCQECILINDSTECRSQSVPPAWVIENWWADSEVFSDSTIKTPFLQVNGKLYYNDSLYLHFKAGTQNYYVRFYGFKVISGTGIQDFYKEELHISAMPNPTTHDLYIQTLNYSFIKQEPVIYDGLGKQMNLEFRNINSHTYYADVSELSSGVYFIFVQTNEGYLRKKVIVN